MKCLEQYLYPTQGQLFRMLSKEYKENSTIINGSYILVHGEAPILLVAHLDTVHKEPVKDICKSKGGNILMSPQGIGGDDRCGVYALNAIYERASVKPWLLFTCDEETGGIGAREFCRSYNAHALPEALDNIKAIVEIDRRGKNDAVYYDCDNEEFEDYITSKGFSTEWGSFSDISVIAPAMGVAAVNLSSGYYNAHTLYEYIDRKELNNTVKRALSIVEDAALPNFPYYEYVEAQYYYRGSHWNYAQYGDWEIYENNEEPDLTDVPYEYRAEYRELLELHSKKELDSIREELGDSMIRYLFESEYGGTYEELFGKEDEEEI